MSWSLSGEEQKYQFKGAYDYLIELTLYPKQVEKAGHVVVLPLYQNQFLFTKHKERGIEWPGGKIEERETPLQAAIRELREETGGQASSMWFVGQYKVQKKNKEFFIKNIYSAHVDFVDPFHSGQDTYGPILIPCNINPLTGEGFSPLVTDGVFHHVRHTVLFNSDK
jgi:8-oxo-dGTP diphosphatase